MTQAVGGERATVWIWTLGRLQSITTCFSALLLVLMMGVTVVDTFGRYLFNHPLSGAAEWVELAMGVIVFAGMFQAAQHGEHVRLDLLERFWSPAVRRFFGASASVLSLIIMLLLSWQLWGKVAELHAFGDVSAYLGVPLVPVGGFMLAMALSSAAVYLVQVCGIFQKTHCTGSGGQD